MIASPKVGEFVEARGRLWLVERSPTSDSPLVGYRLSCVDDDAQGEMATMLWDAEVAARSRDEENWAALGARGADDALTFAAYLRTLRWNTATAADRNLFQAPFRAGIRLDAYQLLPLHKALRLPRVNLLIADDVGLGKTVEAGLIARELLLRRRIDFALVLAPPAMCLQWQEELATKFGLQFDIVDRDHVSAMRRRRGFDVNPWACGSRFIISHKLLTDEAYTATLRDVLQDFRARTLLILDEAHHAAPSGSGRYAIESQFTRAVRDVASRFEHRLFLSATPHNGHSNSFATLLEMLDPQRFTRGKDVGRGDLETVMVRRLKEDLRQLGEAFPERRVERISVANLPEDTPELRLAAMLAEYGALRERRIAGLTAAKATRARLAFVGLQQRLLSSVAAFARTLTVHKAGLEKALAGTAPAAASESDAEPVAASSAADEAAAAEAAELEAAHAAEAAAHMAAAGAGRNYLQAELDAVDTMLEVAEANRTKADARVRWLVDWIRAHQLRDGSWAERRLIIFTEYEDTRRYLEARLAAAFDDVLDGDDRIASFTGITSPERREALKRAFNDADARLRILICTDAAREGINLQQQCHDLVHFDLPWNPSRLEQRNGRIDRKLQPSPQVFCRYFVYEQRPEDIVLDALVRKTEVIHRQLGAAGRVLEDRIARCLSDRGIERAAAQRLAERIRDEEDAERAERARNDLGDGDGRLEKVRRETEELKAALERARARVGVDPAELEEVVQLAWSRAGGLANPDGKVGGVTTYSLDAASTLAADSSWQPVVDELRARRLQPGEQPARWRASPDAAPRKLSFAPAIDEQGRDAPGVVQLHLEHRLVRRLLSRFLAAGFQSGLSRACAIRSPVPIPRVLLLGRLALYGDGAARLHEEIIPVAADWRDRDREGRPLRPLAEAGDAETRAVERLAADLRGAAAASDAVVARLTPWIPRDITDLRGALEARAEARRRAAEADLSARGEAEANSLAKLLEARIARIRAEQGRALQLTLDLDAAEARQREADVRSWQRTLTRLDDELEREPARLRQSYQVRAARLEPVGIIYLWPESADV